LDERIIGRPTALTIKGYALPMRHLKTFAIAAPLFALFYYWIRVERVSVWPAVILGALVGAIASLVADWVRRP
jgi:uncharacterized BrkB/YihY/UPF0761 family membrane protein